VGRDSEDERLVSSIGGHDSIFGFPRPEAPVTEELIRPDELPRWVPGALTVATPESGWDGVSARGYRYTESDVGVPPIRDYLLVAYVHGVTRMDREIRGRWKHDDLGPGDVSLLTRAAESHWHWLEDIEVVQVYLTGDRLAQICVDVYERDVASVELRDVLNAADPALHSCRVHRRRRRRAAVTRAVGAAVSLSQYQFARRFREATGTIPHRFGTERRIARGARADELGAPDRRRGERVRVLRPESPDAGLPAMVRCNAAPPSDRVHRHRYAGRCAHGRRPVLGRMALEGLTARAR
jgi:hypothetical protein